MSNSLKPHGPKLNHKRGIAQAAKKQRRDDAEKRQATYNKLSAKEKIALLDKKAFKAEKQRTKLNRELN